VRFQAAHISSLFSVLLFSASTTGSSSEFDDGRTATSTASSASRSLLSSSRSVHTPHDHHRLTLASPAVLHCTPHSLHHPLLCTPPPFAHSVARRTAAAVVAWAPSSRLASDRSEELIFTHRRRQRVSRLASLRSIEQRAHCYSSVVKFFSALPGALHAVLEQSDPPDVYKIIYATHCRCHSHERCCRSASRPAGRRAQSSVSPPSVAWPACASPSVASGPRGSRSDSALSAAVRHSNNVAFASRRACVDALTVQCRALTSGGVKCSAVRAVQQSSCPPPPAAV
jgi:hypothetical protein